MRWSNGDRFTSQDILFWWGLCQDDRMGMTPPEWAYADGKLMDVSAPDDETIVFTTPESREADQGHPIDIYILTNEGRSYVLRGAFSYRRGATDTPGSELQRRL